MGCGEELLTCDEGCGLADGVQRGVECWCGDERLGRAAKVGSWGHIWRAVRVELRVHGWRCSRGRWRARSSELWGRDDEGVGRKPRGGVRWRDQTKRHEKRVKLRSSRGKEMMGYIYTSNFDRNSVKIRMTNLSDSKSDSAIDSDRNRDRFRSQSRSILIVIGVDSDLNYSRFRCNSIKIWLDRCRNHGCNYGCDFDQFRSDFDRFDQILTDSDQNLIMIPSALTLLGFISLWAIVLSSTITHRRRHGRHCAHSLSAYMQN